MFVFAGRFLQSCFLRFVQVTVWLGLSLGVAWAQGWSAQPQVVSTPQLRAELVAHAPQGVQAGQPLWLGLRLQHTREWHTYWLNPGDSGLPTQLTWELPQGVTADEMAWPLPQKLRAGHLTNYGFEGDTLLVVPLTVDQSFQPQQGKLQVKLRANWLVCRLECIPQEGDFSLSLAVNSSHAPMGAAFENVLAQQPRTLADAAASIRFDAGMTLKEMRQAVLSVGRTSAPLLLLLVTAQLYSRILSMTGVTGAAKEFFMASGLSPYAVLALMVLVWFVLGALIDSISIILLTVPVFAPIAVALGFDPIAFAIIGILAIETGLLTPPFGILIFTVKAALPDEHNLKNGEIFRGCVPYWIALLTAILSIVFFPEVATWLPNLGNAIATS